MQRTSLGAPEPGATTVTTGYIRSRIISSRIYRGPQFRRTCGNSNIERSAQGHVPQPHVEQGEPRKRDADDS